MQAAEVLPFFQIKNKKIKSIWNENFKTLNPKAILIALCLPLLGSTDSEEKKRNHETRKMQGVAHSQKSFPLWYLAWLKICPNDFQTHKVNYFSSILVLFFFYPCPIKPEFHQKLKIHFLGQIIFLKAKWKKQTYKTFCPDK